MRMAELGTSLDDPDVFALDVLNSELNGFGGRLFNEVGCMQRVCMVVWLYECTNICMYVCLHVCMNV